MDPYYYYGKVVFVHSPVEFDCLIDYGFRHFVRERVWLHNADSSLVKPETSDEKILTRKAKQCAMKLILNRKIILRSHLEKVAGKYDKWLADIFIMNTPTRCEWAKIRHNGVEYIDASKYLSVLRDDNYDVDKVDVDALYNG